MTKKMERHMKEYIFFSVEEAVQAIKTLKEEESVAFIEKTAQMIADCFKNNKKILIAGNGGSLCDAMHFAEELTGYFRDKRKALPAIALSEPGHLTCVSNDSDYKYVFSRYVEALGTKDDILIVLTTSGNSQNLINAVEKAKEKDMKTIAFLGKTGGKLKGICDLELIVKNFKTSDRNQEAHMAAIHIIIEMIEKMMFEGIKTLEEVHC